MTTSDLKDVYCQEILRLEPYIKVKNICEQVGIAKSNMSYFLKHGRDERVSVVKLQKFLDFVRNMSEV